MISYNSDHEITHSSSDPVGGAAFAVPTVSNVKVSQSSSGGPVKITYQLDAPAIVTIDVLTNGVSIGAEKLVVPAFKGRLCAHVPADDCRVIAVREFDGTKPVVVSTSRHVASPVFDVTNERWDAAAKTLSGVSCGVPGERYELRIAVPQGLRCVSANGGRIVQRGTEARITFEVSRAPLDWQLAFE